MDAAEGLVDDDEDEEESVQIEAANPAEPVRALTPTTSVSLQSRERVLTTGLLAKDASFRLIVSGRVGSKEIDRLIRKLELDKEILADPDGDDKAAN